MKIILVFILIAISTFSLNSCIKTSTAPTELKIQVVDNQGYPFPNATVYMYETKSDFLNNKNIVLKTTTDANGYLYVTDLSPLAYYLYVVSDCYDDFNTNYQLPYALLPNTLNVYDPIVLSSVGQIVVQSNSNYPYQIELDGNIVSSSLASGQYITIHEVPAGNHTVRVIQLSGYYPVPLDESFSVNVTCGNTSQVLFP